MAIKNLDLDDIYGKKTSDNYQSQEDEQKKQLVHWFCNCLKIQYPTSNFDFFYTLACIFWQIVQEKEQISEQNKYLTERVRKLENQLSFQVKRKAGKPGRKPALVDWQRYDSLKNGGANEKQIAEILGIGESTLRRLKAKRKKSV